MRVVCSIQLKIDAGKSKLKSNKAGHWMPRPILITRLLLRATGGEAILKINAALAKRDFIFRKIPGRRDGFQ